MRATLFLSSLFAVSLIGGAALAERPSEGAEGRRPIRDHKMQEVRHHEASTVREHATPVRHEKASSHREPRAVKEAPSRADNIDRSYAAHAVMSSEKVHQSAQSDAKTINKAYLQARNCSDTSTDCAKIHGNAGGKADAGAAAKKDEKPALTRAQAQEMIDKLHKMMCERHAAACADYL